MAKDKFQNIFHPSDFTKGDDSAWIHALKIALLVRGKLSLMHVSREGDKTDWSDFPHVRPTLKEWGVIKNEQSKSQVIEAGLEVNKVRRNDQEPASAIMNYLKKRRQNLIVLSTHQRQGLIRWFKESVSGPILRSTSALTLVVPRRVKGFVSYATGELRLKRILLPLEDYGSGKIAANAILSLVQALDCTDVEFVLLHIGKEEDFPRIDSLLSGAWNTRSVCMSGSVVDGILDLADEEDVDLIVMATSGSKGFMDSIRGSNTERVIRATNCPVMVVPE